MAVQVVFGLLAAGTVIWFLNRDWFPVVSDAISRMPSEGAIRNGWLDWEGDSPNVLSENHFLAMAVDLRHEGQARSPAHLAVEFGQRDIKIFSLFGYIGLRYPQEQALAFNRDDLTPWWGAWSPAILAIAAGLVLVGLMVSWAVLATLYCLPVWLVALYTNRDLSLRGSWRVAGAALMPGALCFTLILVAYGFEELDMVHLIAGFALHLAVSWIYVLVSPWYCPRYKVQGSRANPFVAAKK